MIIERKTIKIDATGKVPGRLATEVAKILIGKHKPTYEPHLDNGDFVSVENIKEMRITAKRMEEKVYHRHTQYPGGIRTRTIKEVLAKNPALVLISAVKNMLPKNKLQTKRLKRLNIK